MVMACDKLSDNPLFYLKGTHPRYMKFDFRNTEIKNQNGGTDATALPSSLLAINHWFLKWRHVARLSPFKATFLAKMRRRRTFWTWVFCNTKNQVWSSCFVIVGNSLARTAIECSKEVYPNVLLVVFCRFWKFSIALLCIVLEECRGTALGKKAARLSFLRHRCNASEPDAAGISRTYPCAYGTRNLCQQRMRKCRRVEISGIKMYSGECQRCQAGSPASAEA